MKHSIIENHYPFGSHKRNTKTLHLINDKSKVNYVKDKLDITFRYNSVHLKTIITKNPDTQF